MASKTPVGEIIGKAGGAEKVSQAAGGKPTAWAVHKWVKNGIPHRHWSLVMGLAGVTAAEIHDANMAVEALAKEKAA